MVKTFASTKSKPGIWSGTGSAFTTYVKGDLIYASDTDVLSKLAVGTDGNVLTLDNGVPVWSAPEGGLPTYTGSGTKYLSNDGTTLSWGTSPGWGVTGNSGSSTSTNFIGTTDNVGLVIRTNNVQRAFINSNGRVAIGNSDAQTYIGITDDVLNPQGTILLKTPSLSTRWLAINNDPENYIMRVRRDGNYDISLFKMTGGGTPQLTIGCTTIVSGSFLVNGTPSFAGIISTNNPGPGLVVPGGGISLSSAAGAPTFINFTVNSESFYGVLSVLNSSGDLVYKTNPSNRNTSDGTERIRLVRNSGNFLIGTSTDIASSIFTIASTTKGSLPAPKMTNTNWGMISSKVEGLQGWDTTNHCPLWYDGTDTISFRYNRSTSKFQGTSDGGSTWIDLN